MLCDRIKLERQRRGWTQDELATKVNASRRAVQRWEAGISTPQGFHRLALISVLEISGLSGTLHQKGNKPVEGQYTYFIPPDEEEYWRLHNQGHLTSLMLGGLTPEQGDPTTFRHILDIGCGPGSWLTACALRWPHTERLIGVDINAKTLAFAEKQAQEAEVSERVEFSQMDALQALDFPGNSFDLVNLRFGVSWIRAWSHGNNEWMHVLGEMRRLLKPGGIARLVDMRYLTSNGDGINRYWAIGLEAAHLAGYLPDGTDNITDLFETYLQQAQFSDIKRWRVDATYKAGTSECSLFAENIRWLVKNARSFVEKRLSVEGYQQLAEQMVSEPEKPDFWACQPIEVIWGKK